MTKIMRDHPAYSILGLVAMAGILLGLAYLQYQWSGKLSEVERQRLQAGLDSAVRQFRTEINAELLRLCAAFQVDSLATGMSAERLAQSFAEWADISHDTGLLAALYLYEPVAGGSPSLAKLNRSTGNLEHATWPAHLEPVQQLAATQMAGPRRLPPELRPFVWTLLHRVPALVHPILVFDQPLEAQRGPRSMGVSIRGYLILEINRDALREEILPELAKRYFGGPDGMIYQVGVSGSAPEEEPLFRSPSHVDNSLFTSASVQVPLLWDPQDYAIRFAGQLGRNEEPPWDRPDYMDRRRGPRGGLQMPRQGRFRGAWVLLPESEADTWNLYVRHPEGSLDEVVAAQRRKNLSLVFGILALLGTTMVIIVAATRRSQKLARLQMEFVAGVSHELRTPLAVIRSAGDNLADGIVAGSADKIHEYGKLIQSEGRRLSGMVEQILQYASGRNQRRRYDLRPVGLDLTVDTVLERVKPLIEDMGFSVEKNVAANLPMVLADEAALSQCLQDLIDNSFKYSGQARWLKIDAVPKTGSRGQEVQLAVEDHGIGISPTDLPYIFEPFFRGRAAIDNQIHGSGLGLSLTRAALQAMGARITVKSTPGQGSIFTIHLPIAEAAPAGNGDDNGNEYAKTHSAD